MTTEYFAYKPENEVLNDFLSTLVAAETFFKTVSRLREIKNRKH